MNFEVSDEIDVEKLMLRREKSNEGSELNIRQKIDFLLDNYKLENESYIIFSHRKFSGPFLVMGRRLVHGEVRRYVDPIFEAQSNINKYIAETLQGLEERINRQAETLQGLEERINRQAETLQGLEERINRQDKNDSFNPNLYFLFEDKFRGSEEEVKKKLEKYLKYFKNCKNVLDIGCGRGEFLELLRAHDICATGIDINENFVNYCKSKDLNVIKADALEYLENLEDGSLDGIIISQVIEHIEPSKILRFLELCYQKLKFGFFIVIETVNPTSLLSLANFFIDLTHKKPMHPTTLKFLLERVGFRDVVVEYHNIPSLQFRQIEIKEENIGPISNILKEILENYNENVATLNNLILGPQDYSVVGRK